MSGAVQGVIRFELEQSSNATTLKLSHCAIGEVNERLQATYDAGWRDLLEKRLKAFVEQGTKYGLGHEPTQSGAQ